MKVHLQYRMSSDEVRAVVSKRNYDKIIEFTDLHFPVGLDKALTIVIKKFESLRNGDSIQ